MNLRDPAESPHPEVRRLETGEFDEGPEYATYRRRLDAACRLLELTTRPIASVAAEVGYPDPLYFSTRFRLHTGLSPTAYRVSGTRGR